MSLIDVGTAEDGGHVPSADSSELATNSGTNGSNQVASAERWYRITATSANQTRVLDYGSGISLFTTGRKIFLLFKFEVIAWGTGASHPYMGFATTTAATTALQAYFPSANTLRIIISSSADFSTSIALNTIYYLEFSCWAEGTDYKIEARLYDSTGSLLETQTLSEAGTDATWQYAFMRASALGKGDTAADWRVKCNYFGDDLGSVNNSWPGVIDIDDGGGPLKPNANGTYQDFTDPIFGSANHWTSVDDLPADDDTSRLDSSGVAEDETEQCAASTYNASTHEVVAVIFQGAARIASGTTGNISLRVRDGGVDYDTDVTATLPSANYNGRLQKKIYELRPGGGAWTQAAIDALEGGFSIDGADRVLRWTQGHFLVLTRPAAAAAGFPRRFVISA